MKSGAIGWVVKPLAPNPNAPPVRSLMEGGKWKIAGDERKAVQQQRSKIAPPQEETRQAYQNARSGHTIGGWDR